MLRRKPNIQDVNPEVIRKAKHLLEVYDQIPKPLIHLGTTRILISGLFTRNNFITISDKVYRFCMRQIAYVNGVDVQSLICTSVSGSVNFNQRQVIYQSKFHSEMNWRHISSFKPPEIREIVWNCPYCDEIYDDSITDTGKVFKDLPQRRKYPKDYEESESRNQEVLYPIYVNDESGDIRSFVKRSGATVRGSSRIFPFLAPDNLFFYRWSNFKYLYADITYYYFQ